MNQVLPERKRATSSPSHSCMQLSNSLSFLHQYRMPTSHVSDGQQQTGVLLPSESCNASQLQGTRGALPSAELSLSRGAPPPLWGLGICPQSYLCSHAVSHARKQTEVYSNLSFPFIFEARKSDYLFGLEEKTGKKWFREEQRAIRLGEKGATCLAPPHTLMPCETPTLLAGIACSSPSRFISSAEIGIFFFNLDFYNIKISKCVVKTTLA